MKTLNTNNIEKSGQKNDKKSKFKEFLAISVMVGGLLLTSCGGEKQTKPETNDYDKEKPEITEVVDEEYVPDKETNNDLDKDNEKPEITEIVDEEYVPDKDVIDILDDDIIEITDEDNNTNIDPVVLEEFEKPCYNIFKVAEAYMKYCKEYLLTSVNGTQCGYQQDALDPLVSMKTLECDIKKGYERLVNEIKYLTQEKPYSNAKIDLNTQIRSLYYKVYYGEVNITIIDKPNPELSNNDYVKGYDTSFELGGETLNVEDLLRDSGTGNNYFTISNNLGATTQMVPNTSLSDLGLKNTYLPVQTEFGYCFYPPKDGIPRDSTLLGKYTFINADISVPKYNQKIELNKCSEVWLEEYSEFYKKIKEEN